MISTFFETCLKKKCFPALVPYLKEEMSIVADIEQAITLETKWVQEKKHKRTRYSPENPNI